MPEYLGFFWRSFWAVHADRSMETGRISFLAIDRYADRYGIQGTDNFDRLRAFIEAMDGEYIRYRNSKNTEGGGDYSVDFDDVQGIKTMLKRLGDAAVARKDGAE